VALAAKAIGIAVETARRDGSAADIQRILARMVEAHDEVDRIRLFDSALRPTAVSNRLPIGDDVLAPELRPVMETDAALPVYQKRGNRLVLYYMVPLRGAGGLPGGVMELVQLPEQAMLEAVRLPAVVERLLPLIEHAARRQAVQLTAEVAETLPAIRADAGQLQQVLINLLVNAIEAAAPGGAVSLRARAARRDEGEGVLVTVTDTGPGIPPESRASIFKPFFTTKPPGQGTGLGLSICHDIVKEHHGTIALESPERGGTTFAVWLPSPRDAAA
jgi:anti-sigma regulatory factor (Ser/Thr protein kinase)